MHTNLVVSLEKSCISLQHTPLLVGPTTSTMFFHNSSSSTEVVNLCKQCVDDLSSSFFSVCNWWELASALAPSMFRVTVLPIKDVGEVEMSCSSYQERLFHSMHYSLPMRSHIGRQSLSPILLFSVSFKLSSSQSSLVGAGQQSEHVGFFSQGVTAVTHGCSFVHWTAIWAKSEQLTLAPPLRSSE